MYKHFGTSRYTVSNVQGYGVEIWCTKSLFSGLRTHGGVFIPDMGMKPQLTKPKPKPWPMLEAEAKAEATVSQSRLRLLTHVCFIHYVARMAQVSNLDLFNNYWIKIGQTNATVIIFKSLKIIVKTEIKMLKKQ